MIKDLAVVGTTFAPICAILITVTFLFRWLAVTFLARITLLIAGGLCTLYLRWSVL
jgi:energy-converting hydrogenase Eha subunit C